MKKTIFTSVFLILVATVTLSCESDGIVTSEESAVVDGDGSFSDSSVSEAGGSGSSTPGNSNGGEAGLVTAAEWNDLDNWDFWNDLINGQDYSKMPDYWGFYTNNRLSFQVSNNSKSANNALIEIQMQGNTVWSARTDNFGKAELWIGLYEESSEVNLGAYDVLVNGNPITIDLKDFSEGVNEINLAQQPSTSARVEIAFMVDATGSMGDELEFLKEDLVSVIEKVENGNAGTNFYTGTVFYRDQGDDYVVRHSNFSSEIENTSNFIKAQSADGGGDFPEAVHTALSTTLTELQWSNDAKSRIAFLLLDAPPHYEDQIVDQVQSSVKLASEMGVKLIPITASGIDKETEFLMRFMAASTNGTYVFITDDSGIGNDHLEASVGQYEVEKLNDLIVRLINKYSE